MFLKIDLKTPNNLPIKIKPIPASSMKMQIRGHLVPGYPGITSMKIIFNVIGSFCT